MQDISPAPRFRVLTGDAMPLAHDGAPVSDATDGRALAVANPWLTRTWGQPRAARPGEAALQLQWSADLPPEGYTLRVSPTGTHIGAADLAGHLHGLSTFARLLATRAQGDRLEGIAIDDAPAVGVRGVCLDVGRRYCPPSQLLGVVDHMAWLGLNRLHLHLTEWNGWRIALGHPRYAALADPRSYTSAQLGELIAYAHARAIRVTVELNLPAHATALIRAEPLLRFGPHDAALSDGSLWTGEPTDGWMVNFLAPGAAQFLADLVDQWAREVPADAFHLGGDEWFDEDQLAASPALVAAATSLARRLGTDAGPADVVVDLMNRLAAPLLDQGRDVEMWSWPAFFAPHRAVTLDRRITITAWDTGASHVDTIVALGHRVIAAPELTHYVTPRTAPGNLQGVNFASASAAELWTAPLPGPGVLGEQLCIWADWAEDQGDEYFFWYAERPLGLLAERLWGHATGGVDAAARAIDACRLDARPTRLLRTVRGAVGNLDTPATLAEVRIRPHLPERLGAGGPRRSDLLGLDAWRNLRVQVRRGPTRPWHDVYRLTWQLTDTWNRIALNVPGASSFRLAMPDGAPLPPGDIEWLVTANPPHLNPQEGSRVRTAVAGTHNV